MRTPRLLSTLVLVLSAAALSAQGAYYVDAVNGKDTNSGTKPNFAWKSLTKAAGTLPKNSTLIVYPGTYSASTTFETFPITFGVFDQSNCRIIAVGGPAKTIIDGGGVSTLGLVRFRSNCRKLRFSGFTFQNMGTASFWSMAIRMGSASGGIWSCSDVEVFNCVFKNIYRAVTVFGSKPGTTISTGNMIHDNLVLNAIGPAIAVYGKGVNYVYNNTVLNVGNTTSKADGIFLSDAAAKEYCGAIVLNNIVYQTANYGILADTTAFNATKTLGPKVLNNIAFKAAAGAFSGFTVGTTNKAVDPLFVAPLKGDYHLQATSPAIDAGTAAVPIVRGDLEGYPRSFAYKGGARLPDAGVFEAHRADMLVTKPFKIGTGGTVQFRGPNSVGLVLFSLGEGSLPSPYGQILFDLPTFIPAMTAIGTIPGLRPVPIPNIPALSGLPLVIQGAQVIPQKSLLELLNASVQAL